MTKSTVARRVWQCPSCGRTFRIPQSAPPPVSCPQCAEETYELEANESNTDPSGKRSRKKVPKVETTFFEAAPETDTAAPQPEFQRAVRNNPSPAAAPAAFSQQSIETAEILEHLRSIRRTMTMVRWVMCAFLLLMTITGMVSIYSGYQLLQQVKDVVQDGQGMLQGLQHVQAPAPAPNGDPANPVIPAIGNQLQEIMEKRQELNEVLEDLQK